MQSTQHISTLITVPNDTFFMESIKFHKSDLWWFSLNIGDYLETGFLSVNKRCQNPQRIQGHYFNEYNWLQWSIYRFISDYKLYKNFVQITPRRKINHLKIHFYNLKKNHAKDFTTFEMEMITK